jgi:CubicO group peptidase (beta-lactamase class C family)
VKKIIGIEFHQQQNAESLRFIELHPMNPPSAPYQWQEKKMDVREIASAVDARVRFEADKDEFSGTVLIAKYDSVLFKKSYGYRDRSRQLRNTNDTRYHTGSIGKMITAVAIGQLVEQGKLSFGDTLGNILHQYPNKEAASKVTVHELLTHTSGIQDPFELGRRKEGELYSTPASNFPLFADAPLTMTPGDHHSYSNGNFAVLAAIVEERSGETFEHYLNEHIFTPAGMKCADLSTYKQLPRAASYTHVPLKDPLGIEERSPARPLESDPEFEYSGFSNTYMTADDVFHFLLALRQGKLCSLEMVDQLTTGKVFIEKGMPFKYGYGFYDATMWGTTMRGHSGGGSNSGIGAEAEMVWDKNYYVVVLGNYDLEVVRPLTFSIVRFLGKQ